MVPAAAKKFQKEKVQKSRQVVFMISAIGGPKNHL